MNTIIIFFRSIHLINSLHHHLAANTWASGRNMRSLGQNIKLSLHHVPKVLFELKVLNLAQMILKETVIFTSYFWTWISISHDFQISIHFSISLHLYSCMSIVVFIDLLHLFLIGSYLDLFFQTMFNFILLILEFTHLFLTSNGFSFVLLQFFMIILVIVVLFQSFHLIDGYRRLAIYPLVLNKVIIFLLHDFLSRCKLSVSDKTKASRLLSSFVLQNNTIINGAISLKVLLKFRKGKIMRQPTNEYFPILRIRVVNPFLFWRFSFLLFFIFNESIKLFLLVSALLEIILLFRRLMFIIMMI